MQGEKISVDCSELADENQKQYKLIEEQKLRFTSAEFLQKILKRSCDGTGKQTIWALKDECTFSIKWGKYIHVIIW